MKYPVLLHFWAWKQALSPLGVDGSNISSATAKFGAILSLCKSTWKKENQAYHFTKILGIQAIQRYWGIDKACWLRICFWWEHIPRKGKHIDKLIALDLPTQFQLTFLKAPGIDYKVYSPLIAFRAVNDRKEDWIPLPIYTRKVSSSSVLVSTHFRMCKFVFRLCN